MLKIGLTGGIGCGKSTVTKAFADKGIVIVDADQVARDVVAPQTEALSEITRTFGSIVLNEEGSLNRAVLKKQVFADKDKLKQLEDILHPRIRAAIKREIEASEAYRKTSPYVIVDIPLLIEKGYTDWFDAIVVVDCLPEQQIERVQQRDGLEAQTIQSIIDQQISRDERLKHATFVLDNSGSKAPLLLALNLLHEHFIRLSQG